MEYAETFIFIRKRPGVAQLSETDRLVQDFAEPLDEIPAAVNDDVIVVEDETRDMDTDFVSQDSVVTQKEKLIPTITDSIVRQSQRIRQSDFVQIQISKWMKVRHLKSKVVYLV